MTHHEDNATTLAPLLRDIARPVLLWAVHFTLVYAALSAACAPRGLIGLDLATIVVLVATVPAVLWAGFSLRRGAERDLGRAARWSGLISAVAILFNTAPVLLIGSCG